MMDNNLSEKIKITDLLSEEKSVQIKPIGYSMYPLIVPGRDEVIISPIRGRKLHRGDVLLYRRKNSKLILHRVYKIKENGFFFVGDNESLIEGPIDKASVYGIMTAFYHKGKKIKTNNFFYYLSWQLWLLLLPFRKPIGKIIHKAKSD